jgi:hypothetical protein
MRSRGRPHKRMELHQLDQFARHIVGGHGFGFGGRFFVIGFGDFDDLDSARGFLAVKVAEDLSPAGSHVFVNPIKFLGGVDASPRDNYERLVKLLACKAVLRDKTARMALKEGFCFGESGYGSV